ncbi:Short chain dehydrogenase mdpC [Wickerhamiella sorbophila]|uniref:Short chain dehydrogenase mdpC n=1 Tax=Wickerhamiella sorbophila TaxID=45607 RepID=A0A2T0FH45_9ASCO|nr:Short chain dehydrogenase mdpC [Wickerhamiella sorbophila]PRT54259.1 Short chain dehydrogenase mdpC [Wickerhamiella sorbophila]
MVERTIKGKVAFITGGGKNLGALIAKDFASKGAKAIVVHYNSASSKTETEKTVAELEKLGTKAVALHGDLTTAAAITKFFEDAERAVGKPDIAINTVGKVLKKPIIDTTEAEFDEMFAVNTKCAYFFIKEAGKRLNDDGCLITIVTSLLGAFTPFYSTYAGSKAAVEHFTRAASKEFGERGISVNALGPGPMDTPFFYPQESPEAQAYHKTAAALSSKTPSGLTHIEDIVPFVSFLASDGWWQTGQTVLINGGYTTK